MHPVVKVARGISNTIVFACVIGLVTAVASHYFRAGINYLSKFSNQFLSELSSFLFYFISLSFAAVLVYLIQKYGKIPRFEGPADSIYSAHRVDNELNIKYGLLSTIAAFISASGGASVGQYGPLVHFGATIGAWLKSTSKSTITTDVFIGCGVAAAISSGFGAPIAGVIFAHEAVTRHFAFKAIAPISISSGIAFLGSQYFWPIDPPFDSTGYGNIESLSSTIISSVFVAPMFGLGAIVFMKSVEKLQSVNQRLRTNRFYNTFVAICCLSLIGVYVPEVLGLGTEIVANTINQQYSLLILILLLFGKLLATSISLSFGFFGGVFSPALFIGATLGAISAHILNAAGIVNLSAAEMSICGMAAVSGAVIGAPLTAVLIVIELTQSYFLGLSTLVSVVIAVMVCDVSYGHSFFDRQLAKRGIDISKGRTGLILMETSVTKYISTDMLTLGVDTLKSVAFAEMTKRKTTEGYLIEKNGKLVGKISILDLINQAENEYCIDIADRTPFSLDRDASLQQAIEAASQFVGEAIPVIDLESQILIGTITEGDILNAYLTVQDQIIDLEKK